MDTIENGKELVVSPEIPREMAIARAPGVVVAEAKRAAEALTDIIRNKKKPVIFNGEQYLEFEDWALLAKFYGVTAKVRETKYVEYGESRGFEAKAAAFHLQTGEEISAAEAMCLNDEPNWARKPMFQLRSMAQTRACAKALRNVLSWVVVMAGYKPTPAEEMDGVGQGKPVAAVAVAAQPTATNQVIDDFIKDVKIESKTKKGTTSSYKKYTIETATGFILTTIDKRWGDIAQSALKLKRKVTLEYRQTQWGLEVASMDIPGDAPDGDAQEPIDAEIVGE